jgi:Domain of unknown function (DUF4391)
VTEPAHEDAAAGLLALPAAARQDHRITKKVLAEQFAERAAADARLIAKAVATARLVGILRPETIQVPQYRDEERSVVDVPVIDAALAARTSPTDRTRVAELIHRSMAKPVVLFLHLSDETTVLSLALSHVSRTDASRSTSVLDAHLMVSAGQIEPGALHIDRLDRSDMWALYRDLVRTAATDGRPASVALQAADAVALRRRLGAMEEELAAVIRGARATKGQQARINLNTRARHLRTLITQARQGLYSS